MPANKLNKDTVKIGFIGLGLMGSRLVRRLNASGWNLQVWDLRPEQAKAVIEGTTMSIAPSMEALAKNCDIILSCVPNDAAVRSIYLGETGVLAAASQGAVVIDMSTISADVSLEVHRQAARRGIRALDVAISGSTPAVEAGTITLLAGGERDTFELCTPIYESIAKQWFLIGPASSGVRMKLVVNLLLGVSMAAITESVSLGESLGIDRDVLLSVLSKTAVIPPAMLGKFEKIRNRDYSPEFPLRLMFKDLDLILQTASSSGAELPVADAARRVFASYSETSGDLDLSAIAAGAEKKALPLAS